MTLLKPLRYLLIRHSAKVAYDLLLPAALSVGITLLLMLASGVHAFGKDGYLTGLQNLLTILGGFFVAALTLITTASLPQLKEPVSGLSPPQMPGEAEPLSRKRFLAYLFGYLATSSFLMVAITILANLIAVTVATSLTGAAKDVTKGMFLFAFNFWLAHVFIATLLGMFYFTERLQMSDRRSRIGRPDAPPTAAE